ncbi:MAG TPA: hypothetical protein VGO80_02820 [Solirubrobacteraceae bacterium]|jgi:hypothetical protein|nr:hypothetical protein [Solirubrobacteraceae bacterium]
MTMPGFTAEVGIGESSTHYSGRTAHGGAVGGGQLHPALVAPTVCKTSSCLTVGRCKTRVRCCRNFQGICTCTTAPCYIVGGPLA